jgi:hypothetical protein
VAAKPTTELAAEAITAVVVAIGNARASKLRMPIAGRSG